MFLFSDHNDWMSVYALKPCLSTVFAFAAIHHSEIIGESHLYSSFYFLFFLDAFYKMLQYFQILFSSCNFNVKKCIKSYLKSVILRSLYFFLIKIYITQQQK